MSFGLLRVGDAPFFRGGFVGSLEIFNLSDGVDLATALGVGLGAVAGTEAGSGSAGLGAEAEGGAGAGAGADAGTGTGTETVVGTGVEGGDGAGTVARGGTGEIATVGADVVVRVLGPGLVRPGAFFGGAIGSTSGVGMGGLANLTVSEGSSFTVGSMRGSGSAGGAATGARLR